MSACINLFQKTSKIVLIEKIDKVEKYFGGFFLDD